MLENNEGAIKKTSIIGSDLVTCHWSEIWFHSIISVGLVIEFRT